MIDGVSVKMGGKEWIVPPLNLKLVKKFAPLLSRIDVPSDPMESLGMMDGMLELIHAAISRNYQHLTPGEVEDMVDLGNLQTIIQAIMGVSGFVASGEEKAVSLFAGGTSTGTSPQPPAGPGA